MDPEEKPPEMSREERFKHLARALFGVKKNEVEKHEPKKRQQHHSEPVPPEPDR